MWDLFDTSSFPARWYCGQWTDVHGWTHIVADVLTFVAYFTIPVVIVAYKRKRPEVTFPTLFWLFAMFILSCGTVHLVEACIFWVPVYRVSAVLKVLTATVSIATAVAVIRLIPQALALPGLPETIRKLEAENERRAAIERQLTIRSRDLGQFAAIVAHDLKEPLRGISSLASFITEDNAELLSKDSLRHLADLRLRVARAAALVDDVRDYASAGASEKPEHIDPGDIIAKAVTDYSLDKDVRLELGKLEPLTTSPASFKLIVRNLISNAIKHHDRNIVHLKVRSQSSGPWSVLEVEDDGPGIPEEYRSTVFDPLKTLKPKQETHGTGMGLAIVSKAAESLGGSITLHTAEPRGSIFKVKLPSS